MRERTPVVLLLVAVLAGLVALGATGEEPSPVSFGDARASALPEADPPGALSSTWYCAGGTALDDGLASLTVVVANAGEHARTGTVTWIPTGAAERTTVPFTVEPARTVSLEATASVEAPLVSALVEVDGGEVAVEHIVSGGRGTGLAPCASQASTEWHVANGDTERDARMVLALFNPFPDDAVVDVGFSTPEGREEPRGLQGLPVAAGTTSWVEVQDHVRRRDVVAASVVARTGRLVVDRLQSFTGELGRAGLSLAVAAPAPADVWHFPDGLHQEGIAERWYVYNPGEREAQVSLEILPDVEDEAAPLPEPLDLTIPPRSHVTVDAAAAERVGPGVAHSSTVRALNGVPVVAEREVDARRPAPRRGWSSTLGAPATARRWAFPVGEANTRTDEWIVVHNPGASSVTVSVVALANGQRLPIEGLQDEEVPAAGRLAMRLGDHINRTPLPVVVTASGPVVAERDAYGVFRLGVSIAVGIPLP